MPFSLSAKGETKAHSLNSSNTYGKLSLCCAYVFPLMEAKGGNVNSSDSGILFYAHPSGHSLKV